MPALYPIPVAPEDFKIGDNVKWFASSTDISPYVGRVTGIFPKIHKVEVTWPIGLSQKMSPEELILVPPTAGISVVPGDNIPSSYDKQMSDKYFGTASPVDRDVVSIKVANEFSGFIGMLQKKATVEKVVVKFASSTSERVDQDIQGAKEGGFSSMQVYSALYKKYGSSVPEELLREAVLASYKD
jgi:hypothetical protein